MKSFLPNQTPLLVTPWREYLRLSEIIISVLWNIKKSYNRLQEVDLYIIQH